MKPAFAGWPPNGRSLNSSVKLFPSGRIVAAFVMFEGIAFLAIITAAITSTFVARATAEHDAAETSEELSEMQRIERRLDDLDGKLDRLEAAVRSSRAG